MIDAAGFVINDHTSAVLKPVNAVDDVTETDLCAGKRNRILKPALQTEDLLDPAVFAELFVIQKPVQPFGNDGLEHERVGFHGPRQSRLEPFLEHPSQAVPEGLIDVRFLA